MFKKEYIINDRIVLRTRFREGKAVTEQKENTIEHAMRVSDDTIAVYQHQKKEVPPNEKVKGTLYLKRDIEEANLEREVIRFRNLSLKRRIIHRP